MRSPIAITDCRLLTPLDSGQGDTWSALCAGRSVGAQVAVADTLLDGDLDLDRSIRLALAATLPMQDALADAALFCGTSKGPITTYLAGYERVRHGEVVLDSQARQIALGVGAMGAVLRERLVLAGPAHTSVAACSSGLHALHRAVGAVRRNECPRALVVAADASLHPLFMGSFDRLGVLARADERGLRRCMPFADEGDGFFLTEAAAALLLESPETLRERPPLAWLDDSWIGADSTDLIAIDARAEALRQGLRRQQENLASTPLAFVHAHATGTGHDAYELAAIRATCGERVPVFSHKQWLGHSLGAAGLISVVLSALSHRHGRTPAGHAVPPQTRSLTIAQGFGGHIGIVALRGV